MNEVTLEEHLEKFHLNKSGFWQARLKEFGISKTEQLRQIDRRTVFSLLAQIRYSWEAKALKACLEIEEAIWADYVELKTLLDTFGLDTVELITCLNEYNIHSVNSLKGISADTLEKITSQRPQDKENLNRCIGPPGEKCLDAHLKKFDLDATFWIAHLKTVNIDSLPQIAQIDEQAYDAILKCGKEKKKIEKWERDRLRKCLGLPKQTSEPPDLKDVIDEEKKSHHEIKQNQAEGIEIVNKKMQKDDKRESLETEIKQQSLNKEKEPESLGTSPLTGDSDTGVNLVQRISAGLIMKGYFLSKNKLEKIVCKETLLKSPETLSISNSAIPEQSFDYVYYNKDEADTFHHVLEHWGHSMAASFDVFGFPVEVSYETKSSTECKQITQSSRTYVNKTKYSIVPTKSYSVRQEQCQLSAPALKALTEIESHLDDTNYVFNKKCEDFFNKFGSHCYIGTYDFGGIYQLSATYKSSQTFDKTEAKRLCQRAISASFSAACKPFNLSKTFPVPESNENQILANEMSNVKTRDGNE